MELDIMGRGPSLLIQNRFTMKTFVGFFFTVVILIITTVSVLICGKELFTRENPSINISTLTNLHPEFLSFKQYKFDFAFAVQDINNEPFVNESFYYPNLTLFIKGNSSDEKEEIILNLTTCNNRKNNTNFFKKLDTLNLKNFYCISDFQNDWNIIGLKDFWGASGFQMIQVKLYECKNENKGCADKTSKSDKLSSSRVVFYSNQYLVETRNHQNPFSELIKNDFFLSNYKKKNDITQYLEYVDVISDDGWVFSKSSNETSFTYGKQIVQIDDTVPDSDFFSYTLQLNNMKTAYYRKYYKIQDFASQAGGLFKFYSLVGFLLLYIYNYNAYYEHLVNNFYDIKPSGKQIQGIIKDKRTIQPIHITNNNNNINNGISLSTNVTKVSPSTKNSILISCSSFQPTLNTLETAKRIISKKNINSKFEFTFFDKLLCVPICNRWSSAKKFNLINLFNKGKNTIEKYLNVIFLLRMISEYQRLKNILLTNEQYTLFNIVNKPILSNFSNGEITLFDYNDDNNLEELEKDIQILNDDEDEASKKIMKFIELSIS